MMLSRMRSGRELKVAVVLTVIGIAAGLNICLAGDEVSKASGGPVPGLKALDAEGRMHISQQDRCPVCAMMPAKHAKFASAIQLKSGETYYFCGTGCMIRTWMHPEVFLNVPADKLERCVVPAYFSGEQIDGLSAFWVAGSDVVGPMGPALVPLKSADGVDAFRERHGGSVVFKMGELDDQRWEEITGKKAVP